MGEVCKGWEEDIYWTHFQFIHFTQFLRTDFDQQLALPKTLSNNIKKNLPESVTLKGPGGMLWNIGLTTKDNTLYFTDGWQQFVKEHSLKENDFLVFKYNGKSLFEVLIFDGESLCEKAACYFVRKCWQAANPEQGRCSGKKRDSDNSVEEVKTPNGVDEGVSPEKSLHLIRVPIDMPVETTNGKTSNGVDEGVSPEKSLHVNSIREPLDVPIETTNGKTTNAGVESASAEQFMSGAVPDTEPKTVPFQTTGKRTRRKPVYADTSVPIKKRGRPQKTDNSHKRAHDCVPGKRTRRRSVCADMSVLTKKRGRPPKTDDSVEEVKTPNGVDGGVSPEKSLHVNCIREQLDVPIETTNGKTSNAGVESASAEPFMSDAVPDTEPKTVPSETTGKRTRRKPVYADMSVHDCVSGAKHSPKVSPKASPKVGSGSKELYTSNRRPVTTNEIENTLQLAQATCAEDTLLVTMRPTHVYKRFFVSFPNKWRINHLSPSSQDVILRMGKSEWLGKYCYHNVRNNGGITGGWKYFALENNLEEFDVCLFKPAGYMDKTLILEMTIFRVVEEVTPLTAVNPPRKKSSIKKTPTGENSPQKKSSFKKTPTGVKSPRKRRTIKKASTEVKSLGKKRSVKKTQASGVQTELESLEPQVKKRGVNITVSNAVQTELDSIEGA